MWQTLLIRRKKAKQHIRLGRWGGLLAFGAGLTMIPVGAFVVQRDLAAGLGDFAYSSFLGVVTSAIVFLTLVGAGIYFRKNSVLHKRLILLATLVFIWPAWFRFRHYFPGIPRPDFWFGFILADSMIVLVWILERLQTGKVQRAWLLIGILIILEHLVEVTQFDQPWWRTVSRAAFEQLH